MATWTTIESDPGVFHELIQKFGVSGVQVEELWSTDREALEPLRPVYGLIFLFKWTPEADARPVSHGEVGRVFFANQVITNACATQAILSILLNIESPAVDIGAELAAFKDFTRELPPDMKGLAISNSDSIRLAHNSFARPEPLVPDEDQKHGEKEDAFHFIAYVPVGGTLWELDGLKQGPIALCECTMDDWTERVVPHITQRIERYAASEIRFNLMALVADRQRALEAQIQSKAALREAALQRLSGGPEQGTAAGAGGTEGCAAAAAEALPTDPAALQASCVELELQLQELQDQLQAEVAKRQRWHDECVRRRHSYLPLLLRLLRLAADRGRLAPLVQAAKDQAAAKRNAGGQKA